MPSPTSRRRVGLTRRGFLIGTGVGLLAGGGLTWLGLERLRRLRGRGLSPFTGKTREVARPSYAMPGPFPGRVVEVRHPGAVSADHIISPAAVRDMVAKGMCELAGADHPAEAWKRFFEKDDVVGIKVNPVGRKRKPTEVGSISSPEVLLEVVRGLRGAGVKPQDIIVFERYATEFRDAGYEKVMGERDMDDVRWFASSADYDDIQVDIEGYPPTPGRRPSRDPHVVGYDPDVFVSMGFASDKHPRDDRRFRSHLSVIVTRMVNKIVTIPCLKDHRSAGVTLALKNLSHGLNNNVARSHLADISTLGGVSYGPNQCNTFIPTAVAQAPTRAKSVLHIMDGLIGVYEGGPGSWNKTWATWRHQGLLFATDPVAMDHVCWDIIDTKRVFEGWQPVANMGLLHQRLLAQHSQGQPVSLSPRLQVLASLGSAESVARAIEEWQGIPDGSASEAFNMRTPEHVILAGELGLGTWDADKIEHRRRTWDPAANRWDAV
jgi:uncharacterized protein (DUF362 family)